MAQVYCIAFLLGIWAYRRKIYKNFILGKGCRLKRLRVHGILVHPQWVPVFPDPRSCFQATSSTEQRASKLISPLALRKESWWNFGKMWRECEPAVDIQGKISLLYCTLAKGNRFSKHTLTYLSEQNHVQKCTPPSPSNHPLNNYFVCSVVQERLGSSSFSTMMTCLVQHVQFHWVAPSPKSATLSSVCTQTYVCMHIHTVQLWVWTVRHWRAETNSSLTEISCNSIRTVRLVTEKHCPADAWWLQAGGIL